MKFFKTFVICSILVNILFTTCDNDIVGLGQKVVTLAPTIDTKGDSTNQNSKKPGDFLFGPENLIYIDADTEGSLKYVKVIYEWEENGVIKTREVLAVEDANKNWVANIDTTDIPDGNITARIEASDTADRVTTSTPITYVVKNSPPYINMLIPNAVANYDKVTEYKTKMFDNTEPPTIVMDSYLSGVFDDLAGIQKGYPQIKIWKEGYLEPEIDTQNAGYENVTKLNDNPNDGWINVDDGMVNAEKGALAGTFKFFLREHKANGDYYAQSEKKELKMGIYRIKLLVKDMTGKVLEWPKDAYNWPEGTNDSEKYMLVKIVDQGLPPQVTITEPTEMYLRDNFKIKADGLSSGDRDITEMYIQVEGSKGNGDFHDEDNIRLVTLFGRYGYGDIKADIEKEIKIGQTYYSMGPYATALEAKDEASVPDGAYSYVTFVDGSFNLSVIATLESGAYGKDIKTIYIDQTPPKTEITRVSPVYKQDLVTTFIMDEDKPAGWKETESFALIDDYRRYTVNSTVEIDINTTDNRGNATTGDLANNYIKFKYLLLKDNDIDYTTYTSYFENNTLNRHSFSKFLYENQDAVFFDHTGRSPVPSTNINPLIKVTGKDGAYTLTLQTREYDKKDKYKLWLYIAALDNAGNANFQKILLNVDQTTDIPVISWGNINAENSPNGLTFMGDKYSIRFEVKDDNGLIGASSVKVRYARNLEHRNSLGDGGWFTLPTGVITEDELSISVDTLKLIEIACRMNKENYIGTEELDDAHKALLGNENETKYIQLQATDSIKGKLYPTDGTYTNTTEWRPFKIDLTYPVIVASATDNTGKTIIRSVENPFIAPEKDGSYTKETEFTAWGDIVEQNISYIQVKIDGKNPRTENISNISSTPPSSNGFAVWRTVSGDEWKGELRFRIPFTKDEFFNPSKPTYLQDGSHTFEISFFDKAEQYATQTITFYIDTMGPNIDVVIPAGKVYLNNTSTLSPDKWDVLLANSIKDKNAKLIGTFNDSYSPIFSEDKNEYWYRINDSGWIKTAVDGYTDGSKSASWQIPIGLNDPDGVYRLSLRVKDSLGNGYDDIKQIKPDDSGGYMDNLAYLLDRSAPKFGNDVKIELIEKDGKKGFSVKGTITDTYEIKDFIITKDNELAKTGEITKVAGKDREFVFNYWVQTEDVNSFEYGPNTISISVTGSSGQSAMMAQNFILDDRGPEITFNSTGGEKIKLTTAQFNAIVDAKITDPAWVPFKKSLYDTRIKDKSVSAKLSGRFTDDYTPIPAKAGDPANYFWYKIDGPGNVNNGAWASILITAASEESKSVSWEIPIPIDKEDGIYRLSIAVRDRNKNGYYYNGAIISPTPIPGAVNNYGYEGEMVFMLDRSAPTLNILGITENQVFNQSESFTLSGTVNNTYEVQSLTMSINGEDLGELPCTWSGAKTFTITDKNYLAGALKNGRSNVVISVRGSSDQTDSKTYNFIVDKEGPEVTINGRSKKYEGSSGVHAIGDTANNTNTSLNNGSTNPRDWTGNLKAIYDERLRDNSAKITLNIWDEFSPPTTYSYRLNNGGWVNNVPITTLDIPWSASPNEGLNVLSIRVSDAKGNQTTETGMVFMVDRRKPTLGISVSQPDITSGGAYSGGGVYSGSFDLNINGVIKNVFDVTHVNLIFNGTQIAEKGTGVSDYLYYDNDDKGFPFQFQITTDQLSHGSQSIIINAIGSSGQSAMENKSIVIDNKGPEIKFLTTNTPIYLSDAEFIAYNTGVNLPGLGEKRVLLGNSSIKDISARLIGNFIDDFSFVYDKKGDGTDQYGYWYKIDSFAAGAISTTNWQWMEFEFPSEDGIPKYESTSAGWNIPISIETMNDGIYRISLRVKDRLGNGYPKSTTDFTVDELESGGYGYQNNMAFLIERSIPIVTVDEIPPFINKDLVVNGQITNTTAPKKISVSMGGVTIASYGNGPTNNIVMTPTPGVDDKSTDFSFNIPTTGLAEKSYSIMITVTGSSDQTAQEVRNFTFDKTAPSLKFNSPTAGTEKQSGDLSNNGKYSIWWSGSWVTAMVSVGGTADDKNGVDKIYYHIGKLEEDNLSLAGKEAIYNNPANWEDTQLDTGTPVNTYWKGGVYYWTYSDDFNKYNESSYSVYVEREVDSTQTHTKNTFYLPFYVKAVDRAGNINVVHYKLYVDPDRDIPMASIASPLTGVHVGGSVRITGTANDNNWVHSVDIRIWDDIRKNYYKNDADSWVESAEEGWVKAKIVGNTDTVVSWYYNINEDDKLNPDPGSPWRPVVVQVRAWDTKDALHQIPALVSGPSVAFLYYFDSSVPTITDLKITKGDQIRDYTDGIRVSGSFKFSAVIKDDGGISSIKAKITGNASSTEIYKDGTIIPLSGWSVTIPTTVNQSAWESGWRYYIISTGTMTQNDWGSIDVDYKPSKTYEKGTMIMYKGGGTNNGATAMKAEGTRANSSSDQNDPNTVNWNSQYFKYTVEYTVDSTTIANLGYGKTGIFTIELDVYDNNKPPYNIRGTYNLGVDNYYPKTEITTQYNASTKNFTVMGTAKDRDDSGTAILGLERLLVYFEKGGVYYNHRGVSPGSIDKSPYNTINWGEGAGKIPAMVKYANVRDYHVYSETSDDPAGLGPNEATFNNFPMLVLRNKGGNIGDVWESPHAMVIDRQELGEAVDTDEDGTFGEMWNGQVDKIWQAFLNTELLPEGPITVHYIVMDQAGNATHYKDDIYIGNNRPLIREINLGTDFNGDGNVTNWTNASNPGEYLINSISIGNTNNTEQTTNFRVRNNRFGLKLDALYGNTQKHYKVSYVTRGTLVPSTAMVRGKVYTIATPAETTTASLGSVGGGNTEWKKYGAINGNSGTTFVASGPARLKNEDGDTTTGYAWQYTDYTDAKTFKTGSFRTNIIIGTNDKDADGKERYSDTVDIEPFTDFSHAQMADTTGKTYDAAGNMNLLHDKRFIIKVYDSTVSGGGEDQQLAHVALINLDFDNTDGQAPLVTIKPLYWNKADDNSLYENSRANGHIELPIDLPASFNGSSGINDRDPKVSGKVSFRGTAYDNILINKIYFRIDKHSAANYGVTGATVASGTYYPAASFSGSTLTGDITHFTGNGWQFKVLNQTLDQNGHSIEWQLDYDSSSCTNVVDADVTLSVVAQDSRTLAPGANTSAVQDYKFDVVPYITKVVTGLSGAYRTEPSAFNRSALGRYPVRVGETITIQGFNLVPATGLLGGTQVSVGATTNITTTNTNGSIIARNTTSDDSIGPNDINVTIGTNINSGALSVRVGPSISSINNNNLDVEYNKEPNGVNNNILNDDRYLYVWNNGYLMNHYPLLVKNPFFRMGADGQRYMTYGSFDTQGRWRVLVNNTYQGTTTQGTPAMASIERNGNRFLNLTIAVDPAGQWYAGSSNQTNTGTVNNVDQNISFTLFARTAAAEQSHSDFGVNKRRILSMNNDGAVNENRVKIPRIAVTNTDTIKFATTANNTEYIYNLNAHGLTAGTAAANSVLVGDTRYYVTKTTTNSFALNTATTANGVGQDAGNGTITVVPYSFTTAVVNAANHAINGTNRNSRSYRYNGHNLQVGDQVRIVRSNGTVETVNPYYVVWVGGTNEVVFGRVTAANVASATNDLYSQDDAVLVYCITRNGGTSQTKAATRAQARYYTLANHGFTVGNNITVNSTTYNVAWIGGNDFWLANTAGVVQNLAAGNIAWTLTPTTYKLARVFMSYYDGNSSDNPVVFRYGLVKDNDVFDGDLGYAYNAARNQTDGGTSKWGSYPANNVEDYRQIVASNSTTHRGSEYTAIGGLSNGRPVIAWYDIYNGRLVFSYGNAVGDNENYSRTTTIEWQDRARIVDTFKGSHVDLAVDSGDNVHLAYYDVGNGGLYYAYIPNSGGTPNTGAIQKVRVDTYLAVGTKIMLNIRRETINGTTRDVPYISYYHSSFSDTKNAIRVAWRKDFTPDPVGGGIRHGTNPDNSFTGAWEVMTIPAREAPLTGEFICNGVPATQGGWADPNLTGGYTGNGLTALTRGTVDISKSIVVGYMTSNYYEGSMLKGNTSE